MTSLRPILAWLLVVLGIAPASGQEDPAETFGEAVVVVESQVVVALPERETGLRIGEVTVEEEGTRREVTRVEPFVKGEGEVLLIVDPIFTPARDLDHALFALAEVAEDLVTLGPVEIVVLEEGGFRRVGTSIESRGLSGLLARLVREEEGRGALVELRARERAGWRAEAELVRGWLSTFQRAVDRPCRRALCVAILVTGGWYEQPEVIADGEPAAEEAGAELRDLRAGIGRDLATSGWLFVAAPLREPRTDEAERQAEAWSRSLEPTESGDIGASARLLPFRRPEKQLSATAFEVLLDPAVSPLESLASATGGNVAPTTRDVELLVPALERRWTVWYRTIEPARDEPREVKILLDGHELHAPSWARRVAPED